MADFAQLGIELRSIGVDKVNRDIRSVTDNAKSTERAVQSLLGVMGKLKVLMTAGLGIQGLGQFINVRQNENPCCTGEVCHEFI